MHYETTTAPARATLPQGDTFTLTETRTTITEAIEEISATNNSAVALVTIHLLYKTPGRGGQMSPLFAERTRQSSLYLLENIRSLARKTDRVFLHQHTCYFVLPGANLQGAEIVEERLWEALLWRIRTMDEQELLCPAQMTIGHGALPDPHTGPTQLLHAADEVSRNFSTRARHIVRHHLTPVSGIDEEEPVEQEEKEEISLLARKLGIPYLTLLPRKLPRRVLQTVNARLARELHCYPLGRERNMLTVAMLNPQDHQTLERLHKETGLSIFPVLTHQEALDNALKQLS